VFVTAAWLLSSPLAARMCCRCSHCLGCLDCKECAFASNRPINKAMLKAAAKEDEEDAAAAKRRKPDPAKSKLTDLLPAPRNGYAPIGKPGSFLLQILALSYWSNHSLGVCTVCRGPQ